VLVFGGLACGAGGEGLLLFGGFACGAGGEGLLLFGGFACGAGGGLEDGGLGTLAGGGGDGEID
jgi:hypothetical protein